MRLPEAEQHFASRALPEIHQDIRVKLAELMVLQRSAALRGSLESERRAQAEKDLADTELDAEEVKKAKAAMVTVREELERKEAEAETLKK